MLKQDSYIIAAVGTDIGKTYLVENLCKKIANSKAIKPIASGFSDDDTNSDSAKILAAQNIDLTKENLDKISPWRFEEGVSPHFAAKNLNTEISFDEVLDFCQKNIALAQKNNQKLFIELAGGIMSPINYSYSFLDLIIKLELPVLLVSANYLGAISHTLSAISVLNSQNIEIESIIVNDTHPDLQGDCIIDTIESLSGQKPANLSKLISLLT